MGWEDKVEKLIPKITAQVAEQLKIQGAEKIGPVNITVNLHVGDVIHNPEIRIPEGVRVDEAAQFITTSKEIPARVGEELESKKKQFLSLPETEQLRAVTTATTASIDAALISKRIGFKGDVKPELTVRPLSSTGPPDDDDVDEEEE